MVMKNMIRNKSQSIYLLILFILLFNSFFSSTSLVMAQVQNNEENSQIIGDQATIQIQQKKKDTKTLSWKIDFTSIHESVTEIRFKLQFDSLISDNIVKVTSKKILLDAGDYLTEQDDVLATKKYNYAEGAWLNLSAAEVGESFISFATTQNEKGSLTIIPEIKVKGSWQTIRGKTQFAHESLLNDEFSTVTENLTTTKDVPKNSEEKAAGSKSEQRAIADSNNQSKIIDDAPITVKDAFNNRMGIGEKGAGAGVGQTKGKVPLKFDRFLDTEKSTDQRVFNAATIGGYENEDEIETDYLNKKTEHKFTSAPTVSDTINLMRYRKKVQGGHYRTGMVTATDTINLSSGDNREIFNSYIYMAEYTEGLTFFLRPKRTASAADYYDYKGNSTTNYEVQSLGSYYHGSSANPETKDRVTGIQDAMIVAFDNWSNNGSKHLGSDSGITNAETANKSHLSVYDSNRTHFFQPQLDNYDRDGAAQRWAVYSGDGYFTEKWFRFSLSNRKAHHATISISLLTATSEENLATFDVDLTKYIKGYENLTAKDLVWGFTAGMDTSLENKDYLNRNMIFFSDYADPDHSMSGELQQDAYSTTLENHSVAHGVVKRSDIIQQEATFTHTFGNMPLKISKDQGISYQYRSGSGQETVQVNDAKYPIAFLIGEEKIGATYDTKSATFKPNTPLEIPPKQKLKLIYYTKIASSVAEGTRITKIPTLKGSYAYTIDKKTTTINTQYTTEPLQYSVTDDVPPDIGWDKAIKQTEKELSLVYNQENLPQQIDFYLQDKNKKNDTLKLSVAQKVGNSYQEIYTEQITNSSTIVQKKIINQTFLNKLTINQEYRFQVAELKNGLDVNLRSNYIYLKVINDPILRLDYVTKSFQWRLPVTYNAITYPHQNEENLTIKVVDSRSNWQEKNWYLTLHMTKSASFDDEYQLLWKEGTTKQPVAVNASQALQVNNSVFKTDKQFEFSKIYEKSEGILLKTNPLKIKAGKSLTQEKLQWQLHDVMAVTE